MIVSFIPLTLRPAIYNLKRRSYVKVRELAHVVGKACLREHPSFSFICRHLLFFIFKVRGFVRSLV